MSEVDPLLIAIIAIPGESGWWHSSNGESFHALATRMRELGLSDPDILEILTGAYGAVADEFGG